MEHRGVEKHMPSMIVNTVDFTGFRLTKDTMSKCVLGGLLILS